MIELLCKNSITGEVYTKSYILVDDAKEFIKFTLHHGRISIIEITETRLASDNVIIRSRICTGL